MAIDHDQFPGKYGTGQRSNSRSLDILGPVLSFWLPNQYAGGGGGGGGGKKRIYL